MYFWNNRHCIYSVCTPSNARGWLVDDILIIGTDNFFRLCYLDKTLHKIEVDYTFATHSLSTERNRIDLVLVQPPYTVQLDKYTNILMLCNILINILFTNIRGDTETAREEKKRKRNEEKIK